MTRTTEFAAGDLTHLANLCHNCRGCHFACQYTEPHEFALNLPAALARLRTDSWERHIPPPALSRLFQTHGAATAGLTVVALVVLFGALAALRPENGAGFHAYLSHGVMVAIFTPAFLAPLALVALGIRSYRREAGGGDLRLTDLWSALASAGRMKNLDGGQGPGCNFEAGRPVFQRPPLRPSGGDVGVRDVPCRHLGRDADALPAGLTCPLCLVDTARTAGRVRWGADGGGGAVLDPAETAGRSGAGVMPASGGARWG